MGFLVEALRIRGVDARGIDVSTWAIGQVPPELRPFCSVASITDEIEGQYDLITCIEVLEHLPPSMAESAVANLCRHADTVLFSSAPDDFDEPTHLNVETTGYWAQLFAKQGFFRDFNHDASFVSPAAAIFRRQPVDLMASIDGYEYSIWKAADRARTLESQRRAAIEEHQRLAAAHNALAAEHQAMTSVHADLLAASTGAALALSELELRRQAEYVAAMDSRDRPGGKPESTRGALRLFGAGARKRAFNEVAAMRLTKTFRYTERLRRSYMRLRRTRRSSVVQIDEPPQLPHSGTYATWVELYDTLTDADRDAIRARIEALSKQPLISILMPVFNTPEPYLRAALDSVCRQLYPNWELCIADDHSDAPWVSRVLSEYSRDGRVKVVRRASNGHISAASNSALELATGEWVACLDHDDVLSEDALAMAAFAVSQQPDVGLLYSDEDKLDAEGRRCDPYFKPDFDPLLFLRPKLSEPLRYVSAGFGRGGRRIPDRI